MCAENAGFTKNNAKDVKNAIRRNVKELITVIIMDDTENVLTESSISGLLPMAVGLNIDFITMFTDFEPHIFLGGDNAAFWSAMSWTVIFGLSFATFLTLIIVPVMYLLGNSIKLKSVNSKKIIKLK